VSCRQQAAACLHGVCTETEIARITKRAVDALRAADRPALLWDDELPGFGVRALPSGVKSCFLQYRTVDGRLRWLTLGRHGPMTPDQARRRALQEKAAVGRGADPSGERLARRREPTVADVAERYLAEHVARHNRASTAAEMRRLVDKRIKPALGGTRIGALSRSAIKAWHQAMAGTPYEANRALACLSKMLSLAAGDWELRPDNPCIGIKRFPERARERFLSAAELAALGEALARHDGSPFVTAAIKLLVFTGARRSEILGLQWQWIDFARGEARLPDSKTGAKTVHLPPPALEVLAALPRIEGNPHVIAGGKPGAPLANLEGPWRAIRKMAGLDDVRLHDLRHAFASIAASSGMGLPIIGKMLGHTQAQTTARYAHLASDPVKAAAATVAGRIAAAMAGGRPSATVRPLERRQ
jgi:integrase